MTATIGTSTNKNTVGNVLPAISVDSTTAVTLLNELNLQLELPYISVEVVNRGNRDLWVRFYAAATDNIKRGKVVKAGESKVIIDGSDIYTGEISAIMDSGGARDVFVTWY